MGLRGLIFFGDSVLAGTGASERELGCAKLVKNTLKIPVSLRAKNWNTSRDGLERLEEDVIKQPQFSHAILLFGNNDGWLIGPGQPNVPLEEFRQNIDAMVTRIKNNRQTALLCNLQLIDQMIFVRQFPELDDYRKCMNLTTEEIHVKYSNAIEDAARESGIGLIDIRSRLKNSLESTVASDGIHPNDKGHKIIADVILESLQRLDPTLNISSGTMQPRI